VAMEKNLNLGKILAARIHQCIKIILYWLRGDRGDIKWNDQNLGKIRKY
jgi:hypothetical protein